jgi:ABC-2 type transport system permease protein/lipopolysaccharide transport system permease protein
MSAVIEAAGPPVELRFRRRIGLVMALRELWRFRELVRSLAERELRARYKQAILGFAWAVITPLALMVVFTLFFKRVAKVDTGGVPYPLFSYLGLLPWTFFSTSLSQGGQSLVTNAQLLNKVYCPREVFPFASSIVAGIDTCLALVALVVLFVIYGFVPRSTMVWVPALFAIQAAFTLGTTLVVSAIVVYLRDLRHALPLLLQLGLFATPVAYGIQAVPEFIRPYYAAINPLAAVIDGYRRTVLFGTPPDMRLFVPGALTAFAILSLGYRFFKRIETGFADVA